jgi:RNA-directed DNA polymerase
VDLDLEKFFDRVHHDRLMARLAQRIADRRLLKLIRAFLSAGVLEDGLVQPTEAGTPQGGPLSPLLSNLVLDELDRELERRGHRFVRYADDCNIYVRSARAAHRVMESVSRFLTQTLRLKVNVSKSAVARPWERTFLGFTFAIQSGTLRAIAPKALARFRERVREITRRTRGVALAQVVGELAPYLRGWRSYFGFCQTPEVLANLDAWVRRRLRCFIWRQWKRPKARREHLVTLGVRKHYAAMAAGSRKGPWALSASQSLHAGLSVAYFNALGLPALQLRPHAQSAEPPYADPHVRWCDRESL